MTGPMRKSMHRYNSRDELVLFEVVVQMAEEGSIYWVAGHGTVHERQELFVERLGKRGIDSDCGSVVRKVKKMMEAVECEKELGGVANTPLNNLILKAIDLKKKMKQDSAMQKHLEALREGKGCSPIAPAKKKCRVRRTKANGNRKRRYSSSSESETSCSDTTDNSDSEFEVQKKTAPVFNRKNVVLPPRPPVVPIHAPPPRPPPPPTATTITITTTASSSSSSSSSTPLPTTPRTQYVQKQLELVPVTQLQEHYRSLSMSSCGGQVLIAKKARTESQNNNKENDKQEEPIKNSNNQQQSYEELNQLAQLNAETDKMIADAQAECQQVLNDVSTFIGQSTTSQQRSKQALSVLQSTVTGLVQKQAELQTMVSKLQSIATEQLIRSKM